MELYRCLLGNTDENTSLKIQAWCTDDTGYNDKHSRHTRG
jgi:hypothetical protein